jgi:hypothetical protein
MALILLALLAALVGVVPPIRSWIAPDGSPDDRMLAAMQQIARNAQTVLDETGEVPSSLDALARAARVDRPRRSGPDISYHRLGASSIRLCGEFSKPSSGQTEAHPYFDVSVGLQPELTAARPARGRHCYDITLEHTEQAAREDALLFREMNAAATAAECVFSAKGVLPRTIAEANALSEQQRDDSSCHIREFIAQPHQDLEYTLADAASIRLCAKFHRGYHVSDKPARVFDPREDARFFELTRSRPELGRRCYTIRMLLPDPKAEVSAAAWDEPTAVEDLPVAIRGSAVHDARAIGDVVNVLRLARCSLTMSGAAPPTIEEAIRTVALRQNIADRFGCSWVQTYFTGPHNSPFANYQHLDKERVRVCARFRAAWERPLSLNYYGAALADWPTSLPELQRSISESGPQCFTVRLTAIGSGVT